MNEEERLEDTNEIIEITDEEDTSNEVMYDSKIEENESSNDKSKKKNKKNKKSLKEKWNELSKKQKIIIISCASALLVIIMGLLLYFLVFKKDNNVAEKNKEPEVILEKNNYRYENGVLVFLDKNKQELGRYTCKNQDEEKCMVASYSGEDDFDVVKRVYEDNKGIEEVSDIFNNNFVFIYDNATNKGPIILYDIKKSKEQEDKYLLIKKIDEENVIVEDEDEKYGVLKITSEVKENVACEYDYLGKIIDKDNLVAKSNSSSKIIDYDGKNVSKSVKGDIKNYDDNYISYVNNEKYSLYDYNGKEVIDKSLEFITFKEGYVFLIDDGKVYAYDDTLNPLNYEGYKLSTTSYVKKIVYNESLKEISREEAFDIEVGNGTVTIKEGENSKEINVYEGKLNSNYKYLSYFDGTIYVFKDEEKTKLLGSYKCMNKNDVTKNSTSFEKCFIASEHKLLNRSVGAQELGLVPVINNRFVFINDVASAKDSNALLYDIVDGKSKNTNTYAQVDVGYYKKEFGYMDSASVLVMIKNNQGNYGMIKIGKEDVAQFIKFDDNGVAKEIKYAGKNNNDILVNRNGTYYLYDNTGKEIGHAANEIVDYNTSALLLKNGQTYRVTTKEGNIINDNFAYVELYDNFFVGINSNKEINVYLYQANTKAQLLNEVGEVISDPLVISQTDYASSFKIVGNKITIIGGSTYTIETKSMVRE